MTKLQGSGSKPHDPRLVSVLPSCMEYLNSTKVLSMLA
jgi:hypothetical protein